VPAVITPLPPLPASAIDRLADASRDGGAAAACLRFVVFAVACTWFSSPKSAVNRLCGQEQLMQIKTSATALAQYDLTQTGIVVL
jgi:hypothetical protein